MQGADSGSSSGDLVVGVDVGTGSARAGVFDLRGRMLATDVHPIQLFHPRPEHAEHSSEDIWGAVCRAVRGAVEKAGVAPERVAGISFDATCSLVALDAADAPVTLSTTGVPAQNVVVWMDHRAEAEAEEINRSGHRVLAYVGGKLSPEQQPPKLLWIKRHLPESWAKTARFLDLSDFLVYRASGADVRSLCTVVCKWTYLGHEGEHGAWDRGFFEQVGLGDLLDGARAGETIRPMGTLAGMLTARSAAELGLTTSVAVAVGIIDAHAGGLGSIGLVATGEPADGERMQHTLCLIGGTSSCHMAVSVEERFVPGVWGPYFGAMIPGMWLTEGGQSVTGALIDHLIDHHAYTPQLRSDAERLGSTVYELLNDRVRELKAASGGVEITRDLHVLPDFLGNRSPIADPRVRGAIVGLSLDASLDSLARLYYAAIQAIAYGTRHIIEALEARGYSISRIHASGGGTRNALWLQEHADVTGRPLFVAPDVEAVLLGTAMLAAVGAGAHESIPGAIAAMSPDGRRIDPDESSARFHESKYAVFRKMYEHQSEYREMMM